MRKIQPQQQYDMATGVFKDNPNYKPRTNSRKVSPTNLLTKNVLEYIKSHPKCHAWRISTEGNYRANVGLVQNKGMKGMADIKAICYGRAVELEIKYGSDRQSEDQKNYQKEVEAANGYYLIVKDFDMFKVWFDGKFQNVKK